MSLISLFSKDPPQPNKWPWAGDVTVFMGSGLCVLFPPALSAWFLTRCSPGSASCLAVLGILFLAVEDFLEDQLTSSTITSCTLLCATLCWCFLHFNQSPIGLRSLHHVWGDTFSLGSLRGWGEVCVYMYMSVHGVCIPTYWKCRFLSCESLWL